MNRWQLFTVILPLLLQACATGDGGKTIAGLRGVNIDIREERIEGGLEKAMASYQLFLEESPDTPMAPEAIRRLADLKIEKEYGFISGDRPSNDQAPALSAPEPAPAPSPLATEPAATAAEEESEAEFERRTTLGNARPTSEPATSEPAAIDDLDRADAREAIVLYQKLLREYPAYQRNDQVLYQMSRAYEELGRIEEAMAVTDRLVRELPQSRYLDEVQFRRAEFFFAHRRYLDAEEAYASIVALGVGSSFYRLALYKLGWTFYKRELYEEAAHRFIALLDYQVSVGYDFDQTEDEQERKRMDDTFRVISLSFSNLGGADSVVAYFAEQGGRSYEDSIYSNLGEYYYTKRRYSDAVATYNAFVSRNRFHKKAPQFHMRVIEINIAGGFPSLVIEAKKAFAINYGLQAVYWQHFHPDERPKVLAYLKTNLTDLANHYHALYRDPQAKELKSENYREALHWYREFLASFPQEGESPVINYQLADLLMENRSFGEAAVEYEKTAYAYPSHERSATAGYAAVYAYRQHLDTARSADDDPIRREVVRSSLQFAETFPEHDKAAIVLGAAVDDLYGLQEFEQALAVGRMLIEGFPAAETDVRRSAWLVIAHSSYELQRFGDAEAGYLKVLDLLPEQDETRAPLIDNLAASIYKQGEQANQQEDFRAAANHFLRVGQMAPTSKIWSNAEYDAAAALIQLKDWPQAAQVLLDFRATFPGHELQPEVTKNLAFAYREDGQLARSAAEYERIETEAEDVEIRRDALLVAAELYEQAGLSDRELEVYQRYVGYFPQPVEVNLETRNKIAELLKAADDRENYLQELRTIVAIDAQAGTERTARTRYLAAKAALVLAELSYDRFVAIELIKPIEETLPQKQQAMKTATADFKGLLDYEVGEVTAAATFYLAEIYAHFSKALMNSERPELTFEDYRIKPGDNLAKIARHFKSDISRITDANNMNVSDIIVAGKILKIPRGLYPDELEQYELAIEEQAYPFEEKAIEVHESNLQLIPLGVYNDWIEKSLQKLARFVPARYAKPEQESAVIASFDSYTYEIIRPQPPVPGSAEEGATQVAATEAEAQVPGAVAGQTATETAPLAIDQQAVVSGEPAHGAETSIK
jgi:tetratricopeptide (TPR) repeat protein